MPQSNFRLLKSARDACVARKVECDHGNLGMYRLRSQQNGFRSNIVLLYPGQRRNIMAQVFISYSRKDELFAQRLAEALAEQKRECWLDRKDIEFTADWKQRVLRGIEGVNAFVCVVSPESNLPSNSRRRSIGKANKISPRGLRALDRSGYQIDSTACRTNHPAWRHRLYLERRIGSVGWPRSQIYIRNGCPCQGGEPGRSIAPRGVEAPERLPR